MEHRNQPGAARLWRRLTVALLAAAIVGLILPQHAAGAAPILATDVDDVVLSPDGTRIAYRVRQGLNPSTYELYSVPLAGGTPARLDGGSPSQQPNQIAFSQDSSEIFFTQALTTSDRLYRVPATGGAPALLLDGGPEGCLWISGLAVSPDGQYLLAQCVRPSSTPPGLYSVPLAGGPPVLLNSKRFGAPAISPDSSRAVFIEFDNSNQYELVSARLSDGVPVTIAPPEGLFDGTFEISPDSSRVVFTTITPRRLYSAPLAGGAAADLSGTHQPRGITLTGLMREIHPFQVLPDSSAAIFPTADGQGFYRTPLSGGTPTMIGDTQTRKAQPVYVVTPDGQRLIYAGKDDNDQNPLYSIALAGGDSIELGINQAIGKYGYDLRVSPDSRTVVALGYDPAAGWYLARALAAGGSTTRLLKGPPLSETTRSYLDPAGRHALFTGTGPNNALFAAPLASSGATWRVTEPFAENEGVLRFQVTPDGRTIVYVIGGDRGPLRVASLEQSLVFLPLARR
ncbi:MAG TPA: hypothetical protein VFS21_17835 [Roseiflexaceae bacterium]|nr:hypothetical protein [Roseiflexaceae bacterium]